MSKYRFFLFDLWKGDSLQVTDEATTRQILAVLRLRKGDELVVLDDSGFEYFSKIEIEKPLTLKLIKKELNRNEPSQKIALYQSLIKKDNFEWVLQKGTEVGVSEFVPVLAARSEKREAGRPERLNSILKEAAEQSARGHIPKLSIQQDFAKIKTAPTGALNLMLDPGASIPLARYFPSVPGYSQVNILIGPEGGFTPEEITAASSSGWEPVNLGPRILRTETAGVLAAGAILIATQN